MLADSELRCYWTDATPFPEPQAPPSGRIECDLAIVGAGYTGLWTALEAKRRRPDRHVVVLEAHRVGFGGSTRNGGFADASLTHGIGHGALRFPNEIDRLVALGDQNWDGFLGDVAAYGIDARFEACGHLSVATEQWQLEELREDARLHRTHGEEVIDLDADTLRTHIESPTFVGGTWQRTHAGLVDPARLAFGLRDAAVRAGVDLHEQAAVGRVEPDGAGIRLTGPWGSAHAARAILATNAFAPLARPIRRAVVPVYDYVLVTEPLGRDRLDAIGWANRQGVSDSATRFHYFRLVDERLLWGGYDAIYHYGSRVDPTLEDRAATYELLASQLLTTFPQLEGVRCTHRWAGVIDTSTRFAVSFGTLHDGRVSFAVGYTGLGVVASRFGAHVALALLDQPGSELTRLRFVRDRPFPFPPEPFRWLGITLTRRALARADRRGGRRGTWLGLLDRFGIGFDS